MRHSWRFLHRCAPIVVATTSIWAFNPGAHAQDSSRDQAGQQQTQTNRAATTAEGGTQSMRTGDGMLIIRADVPQEARSEEQFKYNVTVENAADNVTLHDIKIKLDGGEGVNIESVQANWDNQSQSGNASSDSQKQADQNGQGSDKEHGQQQREKQSASKNQLSIDQLDPGESRSFEVTASASQEGAAKACLMVESYKPSLCLQTTVVKPELSIVKTSPDRVHQCDLIELTYTVKNDGTGMVGEFEVVDELGDGLRTIDGEDRLAFKVDQLEAGDTRRFVASVYATKTGTFKSRSEARATGSDLSSRSKSVGPEVVGADLDVEVDSRNSVYSDRPATFTAKVTNTGNAPADRVAVMVKWPQNATLNRISQPRMIEGSHNGRSDSAAQRDSMPEDAQNQSQQAEAANSVQEEKRDNDRSSTALATNQDQGDERNQESSNSEDSSTDMQMSEEQLVIDRLEPGQSAEFTYVVAANDRDEIKTEVVAEYICAVDEAHDSADAQVRKTSQAMALTQVIRVPALQIYTVDDNDPVSQDQNVTYIIRVRNEGDTHDSQVQVKAMIPEGLEFDSAEGPTGHEQQGREIVFQPLDTLAAGDEVEYKLIAKAIGEGNVRFEVRLESEALSSTVRADEPTTLINAQVAK